MKKSSLLKVIAPMAAVMAIIPTMAFAATNNKVCVQAALTARESTVSQLQQTHTTNVTAARATFETAFKAAWSLDDAAARKAAVKAARDALKSDDLALPARGLLKPPLADDACTRHRVHTSEKSHFESQKRGPQTEESQDVWMYWRARCPFRR